MAKQHVTRYINQPTQLMLWGMAAGRCQFEGCNQALWENQTTKQQVNIAQKAHIWAFSPDGPRGNADIDLDHINDLNNLMLMCHGCHKLVDQDTDGTQYSAELLQKMKRDHELRINIAANICPNKQSLILLYGANVGQHSSPVNFQSAAEAMFPLYYPAERHAIELGLGQNPFRDNEPHFYQVEKLALEESFNQQVKGRLAKGEIKHLSIFGLAPQPLLILLGKLLSDIPAAAVYQRHREPTTWAWQSTTIDHTFKVIEPKTRSNTIALNLSLSASVDNSRIQRVLGRDTAIWTLSIEQPHNDFMRSPQLLLEFRNVFRRLLDRIKTVHGHDQKIHLFPAVPVSVAVEIGRTWMPKADLSLTLYDEVRAVGGFVKAFEL